MFKINIHVYDDFAHHPTAIATSLAGIKAKVAGKGRVLAVIEPRSNTMRMGEHRQQLAAATAKADKVYWFQPAGMDWSLDAVVAESPVPAVVVGDVDELVVAEAYVGKNLIMKRGRPRARGRFGKIIKPFAEITIKVRQIEEQS